MGVYPPTTLLKISSIPLDLEPLRTPPTPTSSMPAINSRPSARISFANARISLYTHFLFLQLQFCKSLAALEWSTKVFCWEWGIHCWISLLSSTKNSWTSKFIPFLNCSIAIKLLFFVLVLQYSYSRLQNS